MGLVMRCGCFNSMCHEEAGCSIFLSQYLFSGTPRTPAKGAALCTPKCRGREFIELVNGVRILRLVGDQQQVREDSWYAKTILCLVDRVRD